MTRKTTTLSLLTLGLAAVIVPGTALAATTHSARPAASTAKVVAGTLKAYSAGHSATIATSRGARTVALNSHTKLIAAGKLAGAAPKVGDDVAAWVHGSTAGKLKFGVSPFAVSSKIFRGHLRSFATHKLTVSTKSSGTKNFRTTWQTVYTMRGQRLAKPHFVNREPLKVTQVSLTNGTTEAGSVSLDDAGNLPNANDGQWVVGTIKDYTAGTSVTITTSTGDVVVPLDSNSQLVDASGGTNAPAVGDQAAALLSSQDGPGDGNCDGNCDGGGDNGDHTVRRSDDSGGSVADLLEFDSVAFAYASEDIQGQLQSSTTTSLTIADTGGEGDGATHHDGCGDSAVHNDGGTCNTGPWTVNLDSNTQYLQDDQPVTNPTFTNGEDLEVSANVSTDGSLLATVVNLPEGGDDGGD